MKSYPCSMPRADRCDACGEPLRETAAVYMCGYGIFCDPDCPERDAYEAWCDRMADGAAR